MNRYPGDPSTPIQEGHPSGASMEVDIARVRETLLLNCAGDLKYASTEVAQRTSATTIEEEKRNLMSRTYFCTNLFTIDEKQNHS